jgi:hypothetical protein
MELEGSLPCSQKPATSLYPEPDESSPHPLLTPFPEATLILSTHLPIDLVSGLFLSCFRTESLFAFFLHAPPISSSVIWWL